MKSQRRGKTWECGGCMNGEHCGACQCCPEIIEARDVAVNRIPHSGAFECATMKGGQRVARTYYFSSKQEALEAFLAEVNA